jgi:hypothetical protein
LGLAISRVKIGAELTDLATGSRGGSNEIQLFAVFHHHLYLPFSDLGPENGRRPVGFSLQPADIRAGHRNGRCQRRSRTTDRQHRVKKGNTAYLFKVYGPTVTEQ